MCGVLGIFGLIHLNDAKTMLQLLAHRGQDASGIAWLNTHDQTHQIRKTKGFPIFLETPPVETKLLIGSTRYPTFGHKSTAVNVDKFAQPFQYNTRYGILTLAHNGNIINVEHEDDYIYESDADFIATILGRRIDKHRGDLLEAVKETMEILDGAYSAVAMFNENLIAFRDPWAIRPLIVGKNAKTNTWVVSSESVVLEPLEAEIVKNVNPGELIIFGEDS